MNKNLETDLSIVPTCAVEVKLPSFSFINPNTKSFFSTLAFYDYVDVITFCTSHYIPSFKVRRLLSCYGISRRVHWAEEHRRIQNLHVKLYIGWIHSASQPEAFISTANMVAPGYIMDLSMRMTQEQTKEAVKLFETLWQNAKPISASRRK